jgi:hypothetical protein
MQDQTCTPSSLQHTTAGPSISIASVFGRTNFQAVKQLSADHRCLLVFSVSRMREFILEEPKKRPKDANLRHPAGGRW